MARKTDERLPHEYFPPIHFTAAGKDHATQQTNLIHARQNPAYTYAMALVAECMSRRGDVIMLDYSQAQVNVQFSVDGLWQNSPPRDRQSGDAMLACLKQLAALKHAERRARQEGRFGAEFRGQKFNVQLISQGVPTGERVVIKILPKKSPFSTLEELGMRDKMREQFKELINSGKGLVIFSAPPGGGLSTTWRIGLETADRFVKDFISMESKTSTDEEIINVNQYRFDPAAGESPDKLLPNVLLKQPDVVVLPELVNTETLNLALSYINEDIKMAVTRVQAKESVEAILRVMAYKPSVEEFAKALTMVINQRLIRKLCDCKQPFQPPPQLLQRLGIPPGRIQVLYREWQPPPPDPKAKEEPQICPKCNGLGYFGRTAVFELLAVNDRFREALVKTPKVDVLRQVARQGGFKTIQEEGILLVVKGVTSLTELQRILQTP